MRSMGHAQITDKDVLGHLWTQYGVSQNAVGQRISGAMKSGVWSTFGHYLVCEQAVLVPFEGRVVTVISYEMYEEKVRSVIAGRLRKVERSAAA
jgi:hypothetical protein